jgi:two-component SAPR family response regulator
MILSHCLIVDEDLESINLTKDVLKGYNQLMKIDVCSSSSEAMDFLINEHPQVILFDLNIPFPIETVLEEYCPFEDENKSRMGILITSDIDMSTAMNVVTKPLTSFKLLSILSGIEKN